jgi:hypothetical protein
LSDIGSRQKVRKKCESRHELDTNTIKEVDKDKLSTKMRAYQTP